MGTSIRKEFLEFEFNFNTDYIQNIDRERENVRFKILKLINCNIARFKDDTFFKVIHETSHLFLISITIEDKISEYNDLELLNHYFKNDRPWIIQFISKDGESKVFVKEYKCKFEKSDCYNIEKNIYDCCDMLSIMQIIDKKICTWNNDLLKMKLEEFFHFKALKNSASSNTICFQFLQLFEMQDGINYELTNYACAFKGIMNFLVLLEFPFIEDFESQEMSDLHWKKAETNVKCDKTHFFLKFLSNLVFDFILRGNEKRKKVLEAAIEKNNVDVLKFLLRSFDSVLPDKVWDNAWNNENYKCYRELCLKYNVNVNRINDLETEIKLLHVKIIDGKLTTGNVEDFKSKYPEIVCAYDNEGKSALSTALQCKKFKLYALLKYKDFDNGNNNFSKFYQNLSDDEKKEINILILEYHGHSEDAYFHCMMINSRIGFYKGDKKTKFEIVENMFHLLIDIEPIKFILKMLGDNSFTIDFDFGNDHVKHICFGGSDKSLGRANVLTGEIFIGSKSHKSRMREICGTIIHEITHYVLHLLYKNGGKPYKATNESKRKEFDSICQDLDKLCKTNAIVDQTIRSVFESGYKSEVYHEELIVRVPQLIVLFADKEQYKKFGEKSHYCSKLFEFFNKYIKSDIKNYHDVPRRNMNKLNDEMKFFSHLNECGIRFRIEGGVLPDSELNKFAAKDLIEKAKVIFSNSSCFTGLWLFQYYEISVRKTHGFHWPNQIFAMFQNLKDETTFLQAKSAIDSEYNPKLIINCENSQEDVDKTITRLITRQDLLKNLIFLLTCENESSQANFEMGSSMKIRNFTHTISQLTDDSSEKVLRSTVKFQGFSLPYNQIINFEQNILDSFPLDILTKDYEYCIGEELKFDEFFYFDRKFYHNNQHTRQQTLTLPELIEDAKSNPIVIISGDTGSGKSQTFIEIVKILKKKTDPVNENGKYWVSLINLSRNDSYKICSNKDSLKDLIMKLLKIVKKFDQHIYQSCFKRGRVIILFDGFDDVSVDARKRLVSLINSRDSSKENQFWLAIKTGLDDELPKILHQKIIKITWSKKEQKDFVVEMSKKEISSDEANALLDCVSRSKFSDFLKTPKNLSILTEIYMEKVRPTLAYSKLRVFDIYKEFTFKIFERSLNQLTSNNHEKILFPVMYTLRNFHQKIAVNILLGSESNRQWFKYNTFGWSEQNLLDMGMLSSTNNTLKSAVFFHEPVAAYFVAEFVISNLDAEDHLLSLVSEITLQILYEECHKSIRFFLNDALKACLKPNETCRITTHLIEKAKIESVDKFSKILQNVLKENLSSLVKLVLCVMDQFGRDKAHDVLLLGQLLEKENILMLACRSEVNILKQIIDKFEKFVTTYEDLKLFLEQKETDSGKNALCIISTRKSSTVESAEILKTVWSFIENIYKSHEKQKFELLLMRDKNGLTAFQLSIMHNNISTFKNLCKIIKKLPNNISNDLLNIKYQNKNILFLAKSKNRRTILKILKKHFPGIWQKPKFIKI